MPNKEYYLKNRERLLAAQKKYQTDHKKERDAYYAGWLKQNKDSVKVYKKTYEKSRRDEIKDKLFNTLGRICKKCGYCDVRALQIDHIEGGGTKHRKSVTGIAYYNSIFNDPELLTKYQILCANCNAIKKLENNEYDRNG